MPLIYWFSRRMTLWGSISFNLAVFINIIIAFFYPYVEGASTGQDGGGRQGLRAHLGRAWGGQVWSGQKCPALPSGCTPHRGGDTGVVQWDRVSDLCRQLTHSHTHTSQRPAVAAAAGEGLLPQA